MTIDEFYRIAKITADYMPYEGTYILTVRAGAGFVRRFAYTNEFFRDAWDPTGYMRAEIYHAFLKWFKGDDDALV